MAQVTRTEPLPDGAELRYYDDGRVQAISPEGKFMKHDKNKMPAHAARATVSARTYKREAEAADSVEGVLTELGLDSDSEINRSLAGQFLDRRSGAVSAVKELFKRAGLDGGGTTLEKEVEFIDAGAVKLAKLRGEWYFRTTSSVAERILAVMRKGVAK